MLLDQVMDRGTEVVPASEEVRELEIDNNKFALRSELEHLLRSLAAFHMRRDGRRNVVT